MHLSIPVTNAARLLILSSATLAVAPGVVDESEPKKSITAEVIFIQLKSPRPIPQPEMRGGDAEAVLKEWENGDALDQVMRSRFKTLDGQSIAVDCKQTDRRQSTRMLTSFTPRVLENGSIDVDVKCEVASGKFEPKNRAKVDTTVTLKPGELVRLGGMQTSMTTTNAATTYELTEFFVRGELEAKTPSRGVNDN
jgi:hypothetical protein